MNSRRMDRPSGSTLIEIATLAVAYGMAAKVGLMLDAVSGFASLVWPASGIALGALVIRGPKLWPGIWIGALVANYLNGANLLAAAGVATGNTLEALVACYLLAALEFRPSFKRVRDALLLITVAAFGSTVISATMGVGTLSLAGVVPPGERFIAWRAWWVGDMIGDLVVAPMILVWSRSLAKGPRASRLYESAALAAVAALTVIVVFISPLRSAAEGFSGIYLVYPVLIWAAVRFGPRGAISTGFIISAAAVIATVGGSGPFVNAQLHESLLALQIFIGVQAATFLVLGASIGERREATRALVEARASSEEANRAKSEFLAVMSHELRTPLNAISGYVQLLDMELHGPVSEQQRDSLERIQHNQRHLLTLINDILGYARIETGKLKLHMEAIPVVDAIGDMEPLIHPDVVRKNIRYTAKTWDMKRTVYADRERLRQILLNVVSNSIKFTPAGGEVALTADCDGAGYIVLKVRDTGIGIAPEHQARVFDPFVQAETGRTRLHSGVGLGLAIVRDLAQAMNGSVWLESKEGEGTTVTVKLPEGPPLNLGSARQSQ